MLFIFSPLSHNPFILLLLLHAFFVYAPFPFPWRSRPFLLTFPLSHWALEFHSLTISSMPKPFPLNSALILDPVPLLSIPASISIFAFVNAPIRNPPPRMRFSLTEKFCPSKSRRSRKSHICVSISLLSLIILLHWRERNRSILMRRNVWRKIARPRKSRTPSVVILKRSKARISNHFGVSREAVAVALVTLAAYVHYRFYHEATPPALRRILSERHYQRTV